MGGLASVLVTRAEKLQDIVILALTIQKSLWFQFNKPVASIGWIKPTNATYLVAGKSLEIFLPKFMMTVITGQEQNLGMVIKKGIG